MLINCYWIELGFCIEALQSHVQGMGEGRCFAMHVVIDRNDRNDTARRWSCVAEHCTHFFKSSVLNVNPLLKNMKLTAAILTVISGRRGPPFFPIDGSIFALESRGVTASC